MERLQLIVEIFTFICLLSALFINIDYLQQKSTLFHKVKLFTVAASIVGLIVYFRVLAQYCFVFILISIFSIEKKKQEHGKNGNKLPDR